MSYPRRNDLSLTPHGSQLSPTSTQSIATQIPYSYGTGQLAAAGFTEEQRAGITLDRQRYLAMSNVVLGVPIHTTYGGESSFAGQQLAAAPAFSANTADMCCLESSAAGCRVDHAAPRYAYTINPRTGEDIFLEVREDTGTPVNWISPRIVKEHLLQLQRIEQDAHFSDFGGNTYRPKWKVQIAWAGKMQKTKSTEFYVADENAPFDLLVGSRFIRNVGHAHAVFLDEPLLQETALVMFQKKLTKEERAEQRRKKAEADAISAELEKKRSRQRIGQSSQSGGSSSGSRSKSFWGLGLERLS